MRRYGQRTKDYSPAGYFTVGIVMIIGSVMINPQRMALLIFFGIILVILGIVSLNRSREVSRILRGHDTVVPQQRPGISRLGGKVRIDTGSRIRIPEKESAYRQILERQYRQRQYIEAEKARQQPKGQVRVHPERRYKSCLLCGAPNHINAGSCHKCRSRF